MDCDYTKRSYLLPEGCKDLIDVLKLKHKPTQRDDVANAILAKVKRQVDPKQIQMFDLYVVKKWPALKVARILGVKVSQVYLAKHRILALIEKEIRKLKGDMF